MSDVTAAQSFPPPPPEPGGPRDHRGPGTPGQRRGLAITALALGALALLGSWLPVVNVISIVLALAGLGVGVPALVRAARGTGGGRALAAAGIALSALAILVAILVSVLFGAAFTRFVTDTLRGTEPAPAVTAPVEPSEPAPSASEPVQPSEPSEPVQPSEPSEPVPQGALAIGGTAAVGDFTVAVTGVNPNGNEVIASANEYADPPVGQFVLVDLTVTYEGNAEGRTTDLIAEYQGTDARNYSEASGCAIFLPNSGYRQPSLRTGGTASYTACFDVPPEAVAGGAVALTSTSDYDAAPVVWATS